MLNEDKVINSARITYVTFNIVSNNKFLKLRKSLNHTRNLLSNLLFLLINKTYAKIPPIIAKIIETTVQTNDPVALDDMLGV